MKTSIYLVLVSFITVGLSACSSYNYYTAGLNRTNMSGYHSFAWLPQQGKTNNQPAAGNVAGAFGGNRCNQSCS